MPIDFYYLPGSAPCRAVLLTAKVLDVPLNLKQTDLMKGEHLTPEFLKLNPQHTIPTINDNGFSLWESRAIIAYLVDQYGKDDSLYPKDPKQRAIVDQRLYFDAGTLYQRFGDLYYPVMFGGAPFDPAKKEKLDEAFKFLDTFLEGQNWAAGANLTIADISLAASVSTCEAVGYPVQNYPNVARWYAKAQKEIPGYSVNAEGAEHFKHLYETLTGK
uniref:GSTd5 n=1 Tax=Liposcelis entomophila TaxID=550478 RepID=A0A1J0F4S9_9NEOP|nr:GSTd5 [Liposcelis entomophila]